MEKILLTSLTQNEIAKVLNITPSYKAKQIYGWIYKGAEDFKSMTNLSAALREDLSQKACLRSTKITKVLRDEDGTAKIQLETNEGFLFEAVLLCDRKGRKTACLSSQIGCAMKCAFCKTGEIGFKRNLSAGEITEQFLHLERLARSKIDNLVFMGMGEPLLNLEAVRRAISILTDPAGRNFSKRRITLSTCGIVRGIYELANGGPDIRLALSLLTADEALRKTLMPVTNTNSLSDLHRALKHYSASSSARRITLEAVLLHGINTSEKNAKEIAAFAKGITRHVNLIPWNPVSDLPFTEADKAECEAFEGYLINEGLNVTVRHRRGESVAGACGQLGTPDGV